MTDMDDKVTMEFSKNDVANLSMIYDSLIYFKVKEIENEMKYLDNLIDILDSKFDTK